LVSIIGLLETKRVDSDTHAGEVVPPHHVAGDRSVAQRRMESVDGETFVRQRVPGVLAYGRLDRIHGPPTGRRVDVVIGEDQVSLSLMR
jgi:hypothetical protein